MFKKILIGCVAALTLLCVSIGLRSLYNRFSASLSTGLVIVPPSQRFIGRADGSKIVAHYLLKNQSLQPINIRQIITTCGCSVASIGSKHLLAGTSTNLIVEGSPLTSGEKGVTIIIKTDQSVNPNLACTLTMIGYKNPPYITTYTDSLNFGDITVGSPMISEFYVETREVSGSSPYLTSCQSSLVNAKITQINVDEYPLGGDVVMRHYDYVIEKTFVSGEAFDFATISVKTKNDALLIPITGNILH